MIEQDTQHKDKKKKKKKNRPVLFKFRLDPVSIYFAFFAFVVRLIPFSFFCGIRQAVWVS